MVESQFMSEGARNRLAAAYAAFCITRAETGELRIDIVKQKAFEASHQVAENRLVENDEPLMNVIREVEADYVQERKALVALAATTPGTYQLISIAHVRDRSTRVLENKYLEARFGVPIQAGNGEEVFWVTRRESMFALDTYLTFSEGEPTARVCFPEEPQSLPTILLPYNTTFPFETRIIDLNGNISSQKGAIDPLFQNVIGTQL